ncbi:hypothetical protein POM88_046069 [Heracleum sosnowskyi]|uniref:EF-hand domain-containing protein n=1 Tax=Heracleum sosnowskyi TaxID=360622 RepID=A0AAD8H600_9APIA|nr:hypothetical protein POM88_046069 [Heracleum sosnowskyi]
MSIICFKLDATIILEKDYIWIHADQSRNGFLGRAEFYNFLKLATLAQSKKDLTPNIVNAALYGPGSAKIRAPQINFALLSTSLPNIRAGTASQQFTGTAPTTYQNFGIGGLQSFPPQQNQVTGSPCPLPPNNGYHTEQGVASKGFPGGGTMAASPAPPRSSNFNDWIGGGRGGLPVGATSLVPLNGYNASTSQGRLGQASSGLTPSPRSALQVATASTTARPNQVGPMQSAPTQLLTGSQNQQLQSPVEVDQQFYCKAPVHSLKEEQVLLQA